MELIVLLVGLLVLAIPICLIVALVRISSLSHRVGTLEQALRDLAFDRHRPDPVVRPVATGAVASPARTTTTNDVPTTRADWPGNVVDDSDDPIIADHGGGFVPVMSVDAPQPALEVDGHSGKGLFDDDWSSPPPGPSWLSRMAAKAWQWLTHGNVPVKVGMLVLFAGVAALLKYVADQGWLSFPIELRLAGIGLAAIAGLAFGWRQRAHRRSFALSLQGGAIGVLLMTIFAAFKLYGLLPAGIAFALCVLLVFGCGVLALAQNTRSLAILGILAGFLSPILMSTGEGNHVALFAWYAVLNAAIFAIAWKRSWRELNLLGFVFTFGIGVVWGSLSYRPEHFASTWPFLALFFAFYLAIPLLNARREPVDGQPLVDGSLVFGNPLVSFAALAGLLDGASMPLAFCALALAALYLVLAWWLRGDSRCRTLMLSFAVLAVGFATLAVPLALSANATACIFALEGAALIWLGLRQQRLLPQLAGGALQALSALAWLSSVDVVFYETAIVNARFIGGWLLALAGFVSAWCYYRTGRTQPALAFYLWGLGWWLATAAFEMASFAPARLSVDLWLGLLAATVALAGVALMRLATAASALAWTIAAGHVLAIVLAQLQTWFHTHPFAGYGAVAWIAYAVLGVFSLRSLRGRDDDSAAVALGGWLLAWAVAATAWLSWLSTRWELAQGWAMAATALPWLAVAAALCWRPQVITWPLADAYQRRENVFLALAAVAMAALWLTLQPLSGDPAPLPWLPLINPLELVFVASLGVLLALLWLPAQTARLRGWRLAVLVGGGFLTISSLTLRSVHHLGGVPWNDAMFGSALAQASLSLVWSVLGVAGWIIGSRRSHRPLWTAGAVLMAVVLAKLILVDRQHLGNLLGIVSFIGYGLLCTAVGYFAPAPPRAAESTDESTDGETG